MSQTTPDPPRLVISILSVVGVLAVFACLVPMGCDSRFSFAYVGRARELSRALAQYSQDYDGHFPPANRWADAIMPSVNDPEAFRDPIDREQFSFGFAAALGGREVATIKDPVRVVLLYESKQNRWNQSGGREDLIRPRVTRTEPGHVFAFVDGHVSKRLLAQQTSGEVLWP